jgi:hypothetical protein
MKKLISLIVMVPYGIIMSGPFAIYGTIGGFILGIIVGKFVL